MFNAGHNSNSANCPGFPAGANYKTITKYADSNSQPAIKASTRSKDKMVASTVEDIKSEDGDVITACSPSTALGNSTDSGASDSVSDIAPLKCKHFIWKYTIDSPLLEFPLKLSSLVDNGCHLVLIRPDIVEHLGLPILTLKTLEIIDVAIKDCKRKKKMELKMFVILSTTSLDQQWQSKCVCTIIASNLCMPIIFGLPFLSHNGIVTDHTLCSCIDKTTGYNLINPDNVITSSTLLFLMRKRTIDKKHRKDYIKELKDVYDK
jgi:hypothetical protein